MNPRKNILFILGNGFDLNYGLPTKYQHFYSYYKSHLPEDINVREVAKQFLVCDREEDWSRLEAYLGKFVSKYVNDHTEVTEDIMIDFYDHLNSSLEDYLLLVESQFVENRVTELERAKFLKDLESPQMYLTEVERGLISIAYGAERRILNFNYTSLVSRLRSSILYRHPHRRLQNNGLIFGVNDRSQLTGRVLGKEFEYFVRQIVKPEANADIGSKEYLQAKSFIQEADMICFFGLSYGETDKYWWDIVRETYESTDVIIILFPYIPKNLKEYLKGRCKDKARLDFMQKMGMGEPTEDDKQRIYVAITREMFPSKGYDVDKLVYDRETDTIEPIDD